MNVIVWFLRALLFWLYKMLDSLLMLSSHILFPQLSSMSLSEVGAAVSVLLGFAPPSKLSASGSSKVLNCLINSAEFFLVNFMYLRRQKVLIVLLMPFAAEWDSDAKSA